MILIFAIALAALAVPVSGGSLGCLGRLRVNAPATIAAALILQIMIVFVLPSRLPAGVGPLLHVGSYALAVTFLVANRRIPWLWLVGIGGMANFVAIGANGGVMPASAAAMAGAGEVTTSSQFANSAHVVGAHLQFLGDIFYIPRDWPMANVFSAGDVVLVIGVALLFHSVCRGKVPVSPL